MPKVRKILFRVDCNKDVGIGHLSRCHILAEQLKKEYNYKIYFLIINFNKDLYNFNKSLFQLIAIKSNRYISEKKDFDLTIAQSKKNNVKNIIVDSYSLKKKWCRNVKKNVNKFIIIDDGFKKNYLCDLYIDFTRQHKKKSNILNKKLIGLKYFFLDAKYNKLKNQKSKYQYDIFINLGSGNLHLETFNLLRLLNNIKNVKKVLLVGHYFNFRLNTKLFNFRIDVIKRFTHLGSFIKSSKVCIGSGGINLLERISINRKNIVFITAKHQNRLSQYLYKKKIIDLVGHSNILLKKNKSNFVINKIKDCIAQNNLNYSYNIIDGKGLTRTSRLINKTINEC